MCHKQVKSNDFRLVFTCMSKGGLYHVFFLSCGIFFPVVFLLHIHFYIATPVTVVLLYRKLLCQVRPSGMRLMIFGSRSLFVCMYVSRLHKGIAFSSVEVEGHLEVIYTLFVCLRFLLANNLHFCFVILSKV